MNYAASAIGKGRPLSIIAFELLGMLVVVAAATLGGEEPFTRLMNLLLGVGLILWVTRGRSKLGRLFYTGLDILEVFILGIVLGWDYFFPPDAPLSQGVVFIVIDAFLLLLLWLPSTSLWLSAAKER